LKNRTKQSYKYSQLTPQEHLSANYNVGLLLNLYKAMIILNNVLIV